jgi:hypothetical protein
LVLSRRGAVGRNQAEDATTDDTDDAARQSRNRSCEILAHVWPRRSRWSPRCDGGGSN